MADTSTIARPYAKALFDLARSERKLQAWSDALAAAAAVVADPTAKRALANPGFDDGARATLVGSVASGVKGGRQESASLAR
jgi:F-type H+-transporting ATPase subunit delta